ncbi:MAG: 50S ribosomal protein L9 [Planctomycetota bacterium]|nr:50S ribosomal protein L9 [Planctomycetota bacterium]
MATKTVQLLLTDNVDNLGIVGDVVTVKLGYARNYLLPRELATTPSDEKLAELAEKRAVAEKEQAALLEHRRGMISKIEGLDITILRSCNDIGHLYGSVTQQDVANALEELGFGVKAREVRLPFTIKRIDDFDVLVKFSKDLEANVKLHVKPDRTIEDDRDEMEFDNEGELIDPSIKRKQKEAEAAAAAAREEAASKEETSAAEGEDA